MMKRPKKLPTFSGVYIFRNKNKRPLYIGKAANIKARLLFYFRAEALAQPRVKKLLSEATVLQFIKTDSEIEALVEESSLIKKFRPKYNILMRDDKNYSFAAITGGDFPRVVITHQPQKIQNSKFKIQNDKSKLKIIGPFTDGGALRTTLKFLRRIFPYCTCKLAHKGLCLNAELGKCPGPCCIKKLKIKNQKSNRERAEYRKNIRMIVEILSGRKISLIIQSLKKEIKAAVRDLNYERAARLRDQIFAMEQILRHKKVLGSQEFGGREAWKNLQEKLKILLGTSKPLERVEGYDISNISGTSATGSMAVFIKGVPDKNEYRKFRIKTVKGANDVAMMAEVIERRFRHPEWPFPGLIVLDGGKAQLNAALAELRGLHAEQRRKIQRKSAHSPRQSASSQRRSAAAIAALAKRDEELYIAGRKNPVQLKKQPREVLHFFQRVRDEAHRLARSYHHKLREKDFE